MKKRFAGECWSCSSPGDKSRGGKLCSLATTCLRTPLHLDCTLLPNKFNTICTILHFSQAWYRALLHWSTVELSSPSWSYIGHYCSPRGCGASLAAGGGGGQGHKKLRGCKLETAHPSRRHTEEIKFDASHFSPESATRRNLDHGRTNCG